MTDLICKKCGSEIARQWAYGKPTVCVPCIREYERDYGKRYRNEKRNAVKAHSAVANAVLKGELPSLRGGKTLCMDCGKPATQYDHRDYSKPLDVDPVCASCNRLRGPGLNAK